MTKFSDLNIPLPKFNIGEKIKVKRKEYTPYEFEDSIIISYGDIIFQKSILQKLIVSNENFSIIVDKEWKKYWKIRFKNPLDDAESLKIDESGNISDIGQKVSKMEDIEGQFIGLIKIQG